MKNSIEFDLDLNAKDNFGMTAFHLACWWGKARTVETLLLNSKQFNIDVESTTKLGKNGLQLALSEGKSGVVSVIKNFKDKIPCKACKIIKNGNKILLY